MDHLTIFNLTSPITPKPILPNFVVQNPYTASVGSAIHNDSYSSDITDSILPLGIDSNVLFFREEPTKTKAPSTIFFDDDGYCISAYSPGIANRDFSGDNIVTLGSYAPSEPGEALLIGYAYIDEMGQIIYPTRKGKKIRRELWVR